MSLHVPHLPITVDPLIDEANRRKRRRRLLVAGALGVGALALTLTLALQPRGPGSPRAGGPTPSKAGASQSAAQGKAEVILREIPLPPGARPVSARDASAAAVAPDYGTNTFTQYAYRHAFWTVPEPLGSVVAFLRQHSPPNFRLENVGNAETYPYEGVAFNGRSVGGRVSSRVLVSLVASHGTTIVRADAGVPWTVPRSPREMLPTSVREVDIHSAVTLPFLRRAGARPVTRRVTDPREVAQIVGWFNALNVVQPNTYVLCAAMLNAPVHFIFRSAIGTEVASALVPSSAASSCNAIQFTLNGRGQTSLIDSTPMNGHAFSDRVQRLLGVRFGPRNARF